MNCGKTWRRLSGTRISKQYPPDRLGRGTCERRTETESHGRVSEPLVPVRVAVFRQLSGCVLVRPRTEQSLVRADDCLGNLQSRARLACPHDYATCASPMVPRACGRARTSPHGRHRIFGWLLDV